MCEVVNHTVHTSVCKECVRWPFTLYILLCVRNVWGGHSHCTHFCEQCILYTIVDRQPFVLITCMSVFYYYHITKEESIYIHVCHLARHSNTPRMWLVCDLYTLQYSSLLLNVERPKSRKIGPHTGGFSTLTGFKFESVDQQVRNHGISPEWKLTQDSLEPAWISTKIWTCYPLLYEAHSSLCTTWIVVTNSRHPARGRVYLTPMSVTMSDSLQ